MATNQRIATAAYKAVDVVEVSAWGKRVGAVAREPTKNYYAFQYDPGWIRTGIELAPIAMPLAQADEPFIFADLPKPRSNACRRCWPMRCPTISAMP